MYICQEYGKLQIKIWKHTYLIVKMGSVRNGKPKVTIVIEKIQVDIFSVILGNAFPNISVQAKVINEEMNIFVSMESTIQ